MTAFAANIGTQVIDVPPADRAGRRMTRETRCRILSLMNSAESFNQLADFEPRVTRSQTEIFPVIEQRKSMLENGWLTLLSFDQIDERGRMDTGSQCKLNRHS